MINVNAKKIVEMAKWFLKGVYRLGSYLIQVDDYTIYFESSTGRNYTGNPKFIYEELLNEGLGDKYKCVWSLVDLSTEIPGNPVKVKKPGFNYLYYSLKSKFWIYDSRHPQFFKKNKKTDYFQIQVIKVKSSQIRKDGWTKIIILIFLAAFFDYIQFVISDHIIFQTDDI